MAAPGAGSHGGTSVSRKVMESLKALNDSLSEVRSAVTRVDRAAGISLPTRGIASESK